MANIDFAFEKDIDFSYGTVTLNPIGSLLFSRIVLTI